MPFGFSFGKNSGKQSGSYTGVDNFNNNTNFSTSPVNPAWVTGGAQSLGGDISGLRSGGNPWQYVAGANPLLQGAGDLAGMLGPQSENYAEASGITRGVANADAPSIAGNVSSFMDPYLKQVVDATSADLDHSDNIARQQSDLSNPAAFGGSGIALTKSAMEDALSRGRATSLGGLRSQGYAQALQAAEAQAQLQQGAQAQRLAAGGQIANIADQYGANDRANVGAKIAAGTPLQGIDQARAQAPLDFQSFLTQLFSGLPLSLFQGQTGTQNETGTDTQSGTSSGKTSGSNFGFGFSAGH